MTDDPTRIYVVLTTGAQVAQYRIVKLPGSGGLGEVYLAQDTRSEREVALKFLSRPLSLEPEARLRFLREALRRRDSELIFTAVMPYYAALQKHPKIGALIAVLGLPDASLKKNCE